MGAPCGAAGTEAGGCREIEDRAGGRRVETPAGQVPRIVPAPYGDPLQLILDTAGPEADCRRPPAPPGPGSRRWRQARVVVQVPHTLYMGPKAGATRVPRV